LLYQDELSGFFGAMDKYSGGRGANKDRGFWLQSFNGGPYGYNRISRGSGIVPNLAASMLGGIQRSTRLGDVGGIEAWANDALERQSRGAYPVR
jgi:hypothetical protein